MPLYARVLFFILFVFCSVSSRANDTRIKIGLLDSGLPAAKALRPYLCKDQANFTQDTIADTHGHATNIAFSISRYMDPKTHCITTCKWLGNTPNQLQSILDCWTWAIVQKVKYVNFSAGGGPISYLEHNLIQQVLDKGIKVSVAAGNDGSNFTKKCDYYPACYKFASNSQNFFVVGAKDAPYSNIGGPVSNLENGTFCDPKTCMKGSSMATGQWTGKLVAKDRVKQMQKDQDKILKLLAN